MKNWKAVLMTAVIVLLVVVLIVVLIVLAQKAIEPQDEREIKAQNKSYKLVLENQKLITEILNLRYEAAVIQAKFKPAPQPAPLPVLPPQVKE